MTIGAGLLSAEGVVLAADMKEGYGDTHTYVDKITEMRYPDGVGAIASSGTGYLLDYITPAIVALFRNVDPDWVSFQAALGQLMASIYERPEVKSYPKTDPSEMYTQFLVAFKFKQDDHAHLFLINSTLVTQPTQFCTVIGCGPLRQLGEELGQVSAPKIELTEAAAMYLAYEAKRRYADVGGITQMVSIRNDGFMEKAPIWHQPEREMLIEALRLVTNSITVRALDPSASKERFSTAMELLFDRVEELHKHAIEISEREQRLEQDRFQRIKKSVARVMRKRRK